MAFAHATTYTRYVHSARRAVALRTQRAHDVRLLEAGKELAESLGHLIDTLSSESGVEEGSSCAAESAHTRKRARLT